MNLQFAPVDKVVMKDDNWYQNFVWIFLIQTQIPDINNMKLDLNVSTINVFKIEFNTNDLVANANANANDLYFENQGCYKILLKVLIHIF